jgi:plasmid stabilization system protein ParE
VNVVLRPDAEADVTATYEYYGEADQDLAEQFIDELDLVLRRLAEFPLSARQVQGYGSVRRALLRRFPFAVFYISRDDEVLVLRVIHAARSPETWPHG